jgi:hypothetical protein
MQLSRPLGYASYSRSFTNVFKRSCSYTVTISVPILFVYSMCPPHYSTWTSSQKVFPLQCFVNFGPAWTSVLLLLRLRGVLAERIDCTFCTWCRCLIGSCNLRILYMTVPFYHPDSVSINRDLLRYGSMTIYMKYSLYNQFIVWIIHWQVQSNNSSIVVERFSQFSSPLCVFAFFRRIWTCTQCASVRACHFLEVKRLKPCFAGHQCGLTIEIELYNHCLLLQSSG